MRKGGNTLWLVSLLVLVAVVGGLMYENQEVIYLAHSMATLQAAVYELANTASSTAASTAANIAELSRRGQISQGSESQALQDAVAKVTPAVVSIVESKAVPKLQVTYQNPFGNDPFFQGFGVQVPVYRQVGTTTQKVSAGTGFIVRSNGYIITNKHVVPDASATYTVLLANGTQKIGTVIWRSPSEDLAIVKISGSGYPTITLGDSSTLRLAQTVFAVGNALGQYNNSVSVGVISGLNRNIIASNDQGGTETLTGVIQTDAAINPGNSGGPLVSLSGKVVGINVAMVQGSENIGFALPIREAENVLAQLRI